MRLTDITTLIDIPGVDDQEIPLDEIVAIGAGLSAAAAVGWTLKKRAIKSLMEKYAAHKLKRQEQKREMLDTLMPLLKEWGARDIGAGIGEAAKGIEGGGILPEGLLDFSKTDSSAEQLMLDLLQDEFVDVDALPQIGP